MPLTTLPGKQVAVKFHQTFPRKRKQLPKKMVHYVFQVLLNCFFLLRSPHVWLPYLPQKPHQFHPQDGRWDVLYPLVNWHGNWSSIFNRRYIFTRSIFCCHVSLLEGRCLKQIALVMLRGKFRLFSKLVFSTTNWWSNSFISEAKFERNHHLVTLDVGR